MRISVITLATADQERARDFYRAVLEREPRQDRSGVTYFELEGCWLALYPRADLARYCGVAHGGHGFEGITVSVNLDSAEQVHAVAARAVRAGATVVRAPGPVDWGGHIAWIADPDGHLWELVFNPKAGRAAG